MFKKILLPLDGTGVAESVVPKVLRFLKVTDAEVVLLRCLPDVGLPHLDQDLILSKMEEEAKAYLDGIAGSLREMAVTVRFRIRRGAPAETILQVSEEEGVDLVAMSTHGRTGVGRWFFGSVAEKIRVHGEVPLLLLRAEDEPARDWREIPERPYNRLLLPLDGSVLAEKAIPFAEEIAKAFDGKILLLRATSCPPLPGLEAAPVMDTLIAEARQYLDQVSATLEGRGTPALRQGIPAEAILSVAEGEDVDLIVMTTHGWSGLTRFFMGSVADRVVRESGRPVLLVRSRAPGAAAG